MRNFACMDIQPHFFYLLESIKNKKAQFKKVHLYKKETVNSLKDFNELSFLQNLNLSTLNNLCKNPFKGTGDKIVTINGEKDIDFSLVNSVRKDSKINDSNSIMIVSGHYIPNYNDFRTIPQNSKLLLEESRGTLNFCSENYNKTILCILINDLSFSHFGIDFRQKFYDHYVLPKVITKFYNSLSEPSKVQIIVVSERKLSNKFVRDKKKMIRTGKLIKDIKIPGDYYINIKGNKELVISSTNSTSFMKCVGAIIKLYDLAIILGCKTIIQYYPTCAYRSVELAGQISQQLGIGVNTNNIYKTNSCF